jgi:hypothetical protein
MRRIAFFTLASIIALSLIISPAHAQHQRGWEAENFTARSGDGMQIFNPPHAASNGGEFTIADASGGAFIGSDNGAGGTSNSWFKYAFTAPVAGGWYLWYKAIAPSNSDNSFFWAIDIADDDAVSADNDQVNIIDLNEAVGASQNFPLGNPPPEGAIHEWTWFRASSRGGPFSGGGDATPLELSAGGHTLHIMDREDGAYLDAFYITTDANFNANETDPIAVESQGKLATTWADLKQQIY